MKLRVLILLIFSVSFFHLIAENQNDEITEILNNQKNYEQAILKLQNVAEIELEKYIESTPNNLYKIKIYNALCWNNFASNPPKAMEYAKKQQILAEQINNNEALIAAYDNLAFLYQDRGEHEKSITFMLKTLKAKESINDTAGITISLSGLAGSYYYLNNYELALKYYLEVYSYEEKAKRKNNQAAILCNIGLCYVGLGQIDKGLEAYLKSVELYKQLNLEQEASNTYSNLGQLYYEHKQDYKQAILYLKDAAKGQEQKEDLSALCNTYSTLSRIYSDLNNFSEALVYAKKALNKANQTNSKQNRLTATKTLALAFYHNNNFKNAFDYYKIAYQLKDSILNEASSKQIIEMQTKYDTEKKEAENKLLKTEQELNKAELDKKATQQRILFIGLILALFIVVYVMYNLNQKKKSNKILNAKNEEISLKNKIIEEKNKDITDSINYAKNIQHTILPDLTQIHPNIESFIFYQPKDIVSGDFYWMKETENAIYLAVIDCTGHGVPGAFMSIIGHNSLNRIINEYQFQETGLILDKLNDLVNEALIKSKNGLSLKDGMDLALCAYYKNESRIEYSGAQNSLYIIRSRKNSKNGFSPILVDEQNEFYEIKADKMPIGGGDNQSKYETHSVDLMQGDVFYLFTDGYADQFGGPKGKKFMYKQFKKLLFSIQNESMEEQRNILEKTLNEWKKDTEQVDDVCIMGLKFT
ncbi:MAG: tetratricopeptide repeat protein [Flavobacteriales bacterium]|nr:tetratricopeptide repeat protein [Flavobacteriales bacterium]